MNALQFRFCFFVVATFATFALPSLWQSSCAAQAQRFQAADRAEPLLPAMAPQPAVIEQDDKKPEDENQENGVVIDTSDNKPKAPTIGDQYAQLHLQDGSIIGGDIQSTSIDIKTAYGMLNVPISRIVQIYPGLNSRPEFVQEISKLVADLGGTSAVGRDAAQKELISMGAKIRGVLAELSPDNNAEQKKRITQVLAAFEEELDSNADELTASERSMTFDDTIVTPDFSIVGAIQQKQFNVKSKFGDLRVNLGDIRLANRKMNTSQGETRKTVKVPAMSFFQKKPQSTGIRVNKGDKIVIRADGTIQWNNWNTSSSPEGLTNRSQWNGIFSGKLTARIGSDNSQCVQIGSSADFVAKTGGILYLGVAMRDSYASNTGYTWSGEYKAKIVVKSVEK